MRITKVDIVTSAVNVSVEDKTKKLERVEVLSGKTYKIKSPIYEHAFYVTINDYQGRPFEMFINSKNMDNFQWVAALTRVASSVMRIEKDLTFLVRDLQSVLDPKGGYFKQGSWIPSLVYEIGSVLKLHMGEAKVPKAVHTGIPCPKCGELTLVASEGCNSCPSCLYSKCA